MPQLIDNGLHSIIGTNSAIGVGWKLNVYRTGTVTRVDSYPTEADAIALTSPNANPVVLSSDGRVPPMWVNETVKVILTDASDVVKETIDPLSGSDGSLRDDLAAITGAALIGKATGGTVADLIKKLETNALGTVATGTVLPLDTATSFTGDAGGATTLYAHRHIVTQQGANNVASVRVQYNGTEITGSGTTTLAEATHNYVWLKDSAILTYGRVVEAHMVSSSSGGVTDFIGFSNASLVHTGTGVIGNCVGFQTGDIGHATLVQNAIGFKAGNFTTASSLTAAFVSEMNTGTNKWGLYITGTADNWIEGKVRWGSTSILANAAGTVSIANVGPTNLAIQEWLHCFGTGGSNRYIPLFG